MNEQAPCSVETAVKGKVDNKLMYCVSDGK